MRYRQPAQPTHTEPYFEYNPSECVIMRPLEEEIWAALGPLRAEGTVRWLLQRTLPSAKEEVRAQLAVQIASCVRQAQEYFWLAVEAPPRIAPLLHYYTMLNLAKALIFLDSPHRLASAGHFTHGLADPQRMKDPEHYSLPTETVRTARRGVFPSLFAVLTGAELQSPAQYRLADLLQYCAPIGHELDEVFGVQLRLVACALQVCFDSKRRLAWLTAVISRSDVEDHCRTIGQFRADAPAFFRLFTRVKSAPQALRFESTPVPCTSLRSLPSATASLRRHVRQLRLYQYLVTLQPHGVPAYYLPLQFDGREPLPEACVLYATTFYLGSLVRYQPHIYEAMLERLEAWLAESFIRQCPTCFAHIMLNHLWRAEHIFHHP